MNVTLQEWLDEGGQNPWDTLTPLGSYNSEIDDQGIAILKLIVSEPGIFCNDIAKRVGLHPSHVELWQYLFCGADICDYGTSPRGCFPNGDKAKAFLENWKVYRQKSWEDDEG